MGKRASRVVGARAVLLSVRTGAQAAHPLPGPDAQPVHRRPLRGRAKALLVTHTELDRHRQHGHLAGGDALLMLGQGAGGPTVQGDR
ncbi:hypothetical protein [Nocardia thailandica]|uniref:hypothetical protein n=1 Tax=Nocardia thailandica TaxID=257275 RepID=UPI0012FCEC62|nr:hypothetical protein [Nocardia thailandica]